MNIEKQRDIKDKPKDSATEKSSTSLIHEAETNMSSISKVLKDEITALKNGKSSGLTAEFGKLKIVEDRPPSKYLAQDSKEQSHIDGSELPKLKLQQDKADSAPQRRDHVEETLSDGTRVQRYYSGSFEGTVRTFNPDNSWSVQATDGSSSAYFHAGLRSTIVTDSNGRHHTRVATDYLTGVSSDTGIAEGKSVVRCQGYSVTINADGTHSVQAVGNHTVDYHDGTVTTRNTSGSITIVEYPDGKVETRYRTQGQGGFDEVVEQFPDGRVVTHNQDGTITQNPDGSIETIRANYRVRQNPDGTMVTRYNDGRTMTQNIDGSRSTRYPDGHTVTESLPEPGMI